jgi:hypothetical protein
MQHNLPGDFQRFRLQQLCAILRHLAAQNPANIHQRTATANHADVMGAVADNIAFSAQYSVLQCNSIQRSGSRKQVSNIRFVHHRPPGKRFLIHSILPKIASA